jgi:hypothetical protein
MRPVKPDEYPEERPDELDYSGLRPFPVDDLTLDALEHAMGGAFTVDEDGTHHLVGADFSVNQLLDWLAGIDRDNDAILELLSDPEDPRLPVYYDPRPQFHYTDIIRSLIAEVRRLRTQCWMNDPTRNDDA